MTKARGTLRSRDLLEDDEPAKGAGICQVWYHGSCEKKNVSWRAWPMVLNTSEV